MTNHSNCIDTNHLQSTTPANVSVATVKLASFVKTATAKKESGTSAVSRYIFGPFSNLWNLLVLWQRHNAQKRQLLDCSDRMLKDMGLSRYDVYHVVNESFMLLHFHRNNRG